MWPNGRKANSTSLPLSSLSIAGLIDWTWEVML